jgi:triacylglycerol lipase
MPMPTKPVPVLVHGFLGFAKVGPISYFRGVEKALRAIGITPVIPALPMAGSVAERADALARALQRHPASSFVLIGHSMGGLDGRHAIANLDPDRRIKALITVATPHRGTVVAARLLDGQGLVAGVGRRYWKAALHDLDPATRRLETIPDRPDVRYVSYAGCRKTQDLPGWLRYVAGPVEEQSDGLVPLASAKWGDFRGCMRGDHLEMVGWSLALPSRKAARPFDHLPFWQRIVADAIASVSQVNGEHGTDPAR